MTGGEVVDTKHVEKDSNFELDINHNSTLVDREEPTFVRAGMTQELKQNMELQKEVNDDKGSTLSVDEPSLVESTAIADGLDGNGENLNSGSNNIDNKGHHLPTDGHGLGEPAAAVKHNDSHMHMEAEGTDGSYVGPLNRQAEAIKQTADVKSCANADGLELDGNGEKVNMGGTGNEGRDLLINRQGLGESAAGKNTDSSQMDLDANGTGGSKVNPLNNPDKAAAHDIPSEGKENDESAEELKNGVTRLDLSLDNKSTGEQSITKLMVTSEIGDQSLNQLYLLESPMVDGDESGTEEEQAAFRKEVETFYKESFLEFKAPKFYKEDLNLLKLWRAVIKLGGYEQVTAYKLWRKVGESFNPPKTCTTVSWTFRIFYEKALLEYEKHKMPSGEFPQSNGSKADGIENQAGHTQAPGSGRARRDAAARAMQGWHSRRILDSGEVCHPIIKDKNSSSIPKGDRQLNSVGVLKRKSQSIVEQAPRIVNVKVSKTIFDSPVIDVGSPADWVKINVQRMNDCFEIYALVPGLLREEVHVQSDPAGRLVISGEPKQLDNPWGVTPFKKIVSLPCRIDPHQASAVVTMHGQLFIRVPFEQS